MRKVYSADLSIDHRSVLDVIPTYFWKDGMRWEYCVWQNGKGLNGHYWRNNFGDMLRMDEVAKMLRVSVDDEPQRPQRSAYVSGTR